ncbi:MAG: hypothetical protein HC767_11670 [Akkermansiaceae bacterium]|nr:hypothetical protein [Akkermansiaceae bacterium]
MQELLGPIVLLKVQRIHQVTNLMRPLLLRQKAFCISSSCTGAHQAGIILLLMDLMAPTAGWNESDSLLIYSPVDLVMDAILQLGRALHRAALLGLEAMHDST